MFHKKLMPQEKDTDIPHQIWSHCLLHAMTEVRFLSISSWIRSSITIGRPRLPDHSNIFVTV